MVFICNFLSAQSDGTGSHKMPSGFIIDDVQGIKPPNSGLECNNPGIGCPYKTTKYIAINFHYVCRPDGSGNFNETGDGDTPAANYNAYKRSEDIINEMNKQLNNNGPELGSKAEPCNLSIQFQLAGVFVHKIPYKPDFEQLNVITNKPYLNFNNSYAFSGTILSNSKYNSANTYNYFFYPFTDIKTGKEGGLNGYTTLNAFGFSYGNWVSYIENEKKVKDPWYFYAHTKTILHEVFHTLGLDHPFVEEKGDGCNDTKDQDPVCWDFNANVPGCDNWDNISNNLMGYNPFKPWYISACQICKMHQSLEGIGGLEKKNYVTYQGSCVRPKAVAYIDNEICINNGFGNTTVLLMEGTASSNETKYIIEVGEVSQVGDPYSVPPYIPAFLPGTKKSKAFLGQIGRIDVGLEVGYNFKAGKIYRVRLIVQNDCFIDEIDKYVTIKDCNVPVVWNSDDQVIKGLKVYPNPVNDILNIEYDVMRTVETSIDIIDIRTNHIVSKLKNNSLEQKGVHILNLELDAELPSGQYILRFITSEAVYTQPLSINR